MSKQRRNVSRKTEIIKRNNGNSIAEKKIPVIKNLLDWLISKFKITSERVNELEKDS